MTMKAPSLNIKTAPNQIATYMQRFRRYRFIAFIVFVGALYGMVLVQIGSLSSAEPSADTVQSQIQATRIPPINESVVKQLESLEDNSVSVQALFDEARSNPFQ